ncbi:DUF6538 domain-containing protein [Novosphingobium mangrovi (ex Hu et al. 2023)]|uniref:Tyr recombinase domain-containing protein n=1 Tax=Novosphingobium mangrovi (ex Hu et al. 2023) TaxID=2930094 RepID=A0ABT0AEK0_9SPHN|nr:DUF6538 domain-containing protein [Novosphingobium mangrovi (ex Hu et al. 2023)]MCJ1961612.1 hypothetical protein [Novosphingobium mangrovi (ex Hu et al. 2023)]
MSHSKSSPSTLQRVANHRYLYRRGSHFYFRRAVPKDVRQAFGGKPDETIALKTDSLSQARHVLARHLRDFDRKLAEARALPDPTAPGLPKSRILRVPETEEVDAVVRAWLKTQEAETVTRVMALTPGQLDASADELGHFEQAVRAAARAGNGANLPLSWLADHLAEAHGWECHAGSRARGYLEVRLARAQLEWARVARSEYAFDPRPQPDAYFAPDHARADAEVFAKVVHHQPLPIFDLLGDYANEAMPSPATLKAWRTCLQSLIDHLGHDDAARVSRADVVAWKDALLKPQGGEKPRSQQTVSKKYLAAAKTVFGWAERNMRIPENPVSRVVVSIPKKERLREEKGITDAEAEVILAAALAAEPDARSPIRGFARRWVPWICAYTGARVGEITQLRAEDIFRHSTGVQCIRITPEAGAQKGKQARIVPLHPHLLEQGLLDVVKGKTGPLFYDPSKHRGGTEGNPQHKKVGERLGGWVRDLGVDDEELQPNHGWRHRFKQQARAIYMDIETRDAIQGHAATTEGQKYGSVPVQVMYEQIARLPRYFAT